MQSIPSGRTKPASAPAPNSTHGQDDIGDASDAGYLEIITVELYPPAARRPAGLPGVAEAQCERCGVMVDGPRAGWTPTRATENGDLQPIRIYGPQLAHVVCNACAPRKYAAQRSLTPDTAPARRLSASH